MRINLSKIANLCAFLTILFALFGLFSYLPGFKILGSLSEDYIPMAPSTSVCFIILGLTLFYLERPETNRSLRLPVAAGIIFVIAFGSLCLIGSWLNMDLNFENRLIPSAGTFNGVPVAHMAPVTGVVFFLAATAILLLFMKRFKGLKSQFAEHCKGVLGLTVFLIGGVFVLAYLYGQPLLYQQKTIPMALTTALAFLLLSISFLATEKDAFPLPLMTGSSTRSYLLRFLFPFTVLTIILSDLATFIPCGSRR